MEKFSLETYRHILFYIIFLLFFRGLVPLHNACSYGHFEVTEMLIKHGANVNANDLWAFTPLHEAASKSRVDVCFVCRNFVIVVLEKIQTVFCNSRSVPCY